MAERSADGNLTNVPIYQEVPTKAEIVNKFSPLKVHPELTLYIKPSRPIAKVKQWTKIDEDKCFRVEVLCE